MTTATEFNVKAVSAGLQQYWQAGHGEVFQSGKFRMTLSGHGVDAEHQGFVSSDGRTIKFNIGTVWKKQ